MTNLKAEELIALQYMLEEVVSVEMVSLR